MTLSVIIVSYNALEDLAALSGVAPPLAAGRRVTTSPLSTTPRPPAGSTQCARVGLASR